MQFLGLDANGIGKEQDFALVPADLPHRQNWTEIEAGTGTGSYLKPTHFEKSMELSF
jgi:hypothetical protein